jgi:hypothetical protein
MLGRKQRRSMQSVSPSFDSLSKGHVRPNSLDFRVSFDKVFDEDVTFFTLDQSVLDGIDLLAPVDSNILSEWDKYQYTPYSERVVAAEWSREELFPYSVSQAIADVTLNNYDGYFTRGNGSPIDDYLLPQRPVRILAGFNGNNIPQFVGLTLTVPVLDTSARTVSVHCMDFLSYIFGKPLDQTVVYENFTTAQVLDALFQEAGLTDDQYVLDESFNTIGFVYFEKGTKLGEAIKQLMQAELGSLFMDEAGIIRFRNRLKSYVAPVYSFSERNIVDFKTTQDSSVINVVEIKSDVRTVQAEQTVYTLVQSLELVGTAPTLFISFDDPVASLADINAYLVNSLADGSGTDLTGTVTIDTVELFNTAAKITFDNPAGGTVFLTSLTVNGTPAQVTRNIYLRVQDDNSVAQFEEQVYTIENDFVQDNSGATSLALSILNLYKEYAGGIEMEVKGSPALQIGDTIHVDYQNSSNDYLITKIANSRVDAKFKQIITARQFNIPTFFTLDVSILDGTDVLGI